MRLLVVLLLVANSFVWATSTIPPRATIVINNRTGKVIYNYNADIQTQPASLTKMMTLLLTFKALRQKRISLKTRLTVSHHAANQRPCKLGLIPGSTITVKDAILALITKSANDVAVALAELVGGNEKSFVFMMNREAKKLGMKSTIFMNPSGWKNPRQLSTARDLAKLSRALIREYPHYYHFFSTRQFKYKGIVHKNHNKLLGYHGNILIDGIKTGYVAASGYNIAVSAKLKKDHLIIVVLGGTNSKDRDSQVLVLAQKGFVRLKHVAPFPKGSKKSEIKAPEKPAELKSGQNNITLEQSEKILKAYQMHIRNKKFKKGDTNEKCQINPAG